MKDPAPRLKPPKQKRYLGMNDLLERWDVSKQTVERRLRTDPDFPQPFKFPNSPIRKWTEEQIENYEKLAVVQRGREERA
jgi:hypothetical protein